MLTETRQNSNPYITQKYILKPLELSIDSQDQAKSHSLRKVAALVEQSAIDFYQKFQQMRPEKLLSSFVNSFAFKDHNNQGHVQIEYQNTDSVKHSNQLVPEITLFQLTVQQAATLFVDLCGKLSKIDGRSFGNPDQVATAILQKQSQNELKQLIDLTLAQKEFQALEIVKVSGLTQESMLEIPDQYSDLRIDKINRVLDAIEDPVVKRKARKHLYRLLPSEQSN